jgi:sulfotransferase family protein
VVAQVDVAYARLTRSRTLVRLVSYALFEGRPPTTRGRAVNSVVAAQLRLARTHWRPREVRQPIFLVGIGRSGTTLLGRVLSAHRQVGFLNEPRAMWDAILPEHDVSDFSGTQGRYLLTADDATPEVKNAADRVFSWYATATRSARVVDKYPELLYRTDFVRALFPSALIVGIVREPVSTVTSIGMWSEIHGRPGVDWWGVDNAKWKRMCAELVPQHPDVMERLSPEPSDRERAIVEWLVAMRAVVQQRTTGALDLVVRYEDLTNTPEDTVRLILHGLNLPWDERVVQYARAVVRPSALVLTEGSLAQFGPWADLVRATAIDLGYEVVS